jgi:nucleoside 2-deoxyribosyltransferase
MTSPPSSTPLLVGEIFVDFTLTEPGKENKLRLGGIVHAARALWALETPFCAAAVLPAYLEPVAGAYLKSLGCVEFTVLGTVDGAPNVTVIVDPTEVADQEYETLLRDEKHVNLASIDLSDKDHEHVLIFPGSYDIVGVCAKLPTRARLHIDVAYDVADPDLLAAFEQKIETILISTSSPLFKSIFNGNLESLTTAFRPYFLTALILKENRGGSRLIRADGLVERLPAQLGVTVNSVGVGDAFAAAYVSEFGRGPIEAGWRATYVATAYSQTTYPDVFKNEVQRDRRLTLEEIRDLWGVSLPWEKRRELEIYLAAPDFTYTDRRAIDRALASLAYHNFNVRRPVQENGELPADSDENALASTFSSDCTLLRKCALVFAVPTGRDPGSLVEIGIAIESGIPVVVYDPARENANTMVMAGANHYSDELDSCLNAVFIALSEGSPTW